MRAINKKADIINAYEEERKPCVHEAFRHRVARLRLSNAPSPRSAFTPETRSPEVIARRGFLLFSVTHSHTTASIKIHDRISETVMKSDKRRVYEEQEIFL